MTFLRASLFIHCLVISMLCKAQSVGTIVINEVYQDVELSTILRQLRKDYNIKIAYDNQLVGQVKVSATLVNQPLDEALTQILEGTPVNHLLVNDKVVIVPRPPISKSDGQPTRTNFAVKGMVKDLSTGETLPNAVIRISNSNLGTVTNLDGFFSMPSVPNDTTTLIVNYLGYMPKKIKLGPGMNYQNLVIDMQSDVKLLQDITVYDSYNKTMEVTDNISKVSFNPNSMTSLPSLGELDLFKTIQLMPGVSGENESSANLIIRGSLPSQNLVLLDGFTVYHLDHFFGLFSALNPDVIKDVQVFKGGFESKYGGRVGGVVDIVGKSGNTNKHTFNLGMNLISVRGTLEMPIGNKFNMLLSLRRSFTDVIQSGLYNKLFNIARRNDEQIARPLDDPKFDEIEPDFFFTDVNGKFSFRPSSKDIIALSLYGGSDNLSVNDTTRIEDPQADAFFQETLNETTEWGNSGLSLRWGRQWDQGHYSNLRFSVGTFFKNYNLNYNYELNTPDSVELFDLNFRQENEINDVNLGYDNEFTFSEKVKLDAGLSFTTHRISYKTFAADSIASDESDEGGISSLYSTLKLKLTPRLSTSLGFRLNYHDLNEQSYNEPRLSLNYKVSDQFNLKAAVGKYHQFVNQIVYDDPYQGNQNFWVFSNVDGAPVVESNHYVAGFTYELNGFVFDVEGYVKDLNGLVEFNLVPFFISDELDDVGFLVDGRGRMRGLDFLIQKDVGKYKGWVSYSLGKSEQAFDQVENGSYYPSLQDRRHEIKVVNMLDIGRWHLSSSWIYGTGRPFAEFDINYVTNDAGIVTDFAVVKNNQNNSRLPDYHRLDLSASYDLAWDNIRGQVGLSIFNAYGRKNIKTRKLNIGDLQAALGTTNQPELTYRDLVLIDFTPSIFLNFTF